MANPPGIPGATPLVTEKLKTLGLQTQADLVLHLPLRFEDETRITSIADAVPGATAQFDVTVVSTEIAYRPKRQLISRVEDDSGELILRFLNFYPSQQKVLQPGARLRVFGEVRGGFWGSEIIHPRFHALHGEEPLPTALTPVYPTTAGLGQATLRKLIARALAEVDLAETLPAPLIERLKPKLRTPVFCSWPLPGTWSSGVCAAPGQRCRCVHAGRAGRCPVRERCCRASPP